MHVIARGDRRAVRMTESLRSVPFEGVRSAEPPSSLGQRAARRIQASPWRICRVASRLALRLRLVDAGFHSLSSKPDGRSPAMRRSSSAAKRREFRLVGAGIGRATPARPAHPSRACPTARGSRRVSRTAATSSPRSQRASRQFPRCPSPRRAWRRCPACSARPSRWWSWRKSATVGRSPRAPPRAPWRPPRCPGHRRARRHASRRLRSAEPCCRRTSRRTLPSIEIPLSS